MAKLETVYKPIAPVVYAPGVRETIATLTQKYIKEINRIYSLMGDNNDVINGIIDDLLKELEQKIKDLIDELTKGDMVVKEAEMANKTKGTLTMQANGEELGKFNGSKDVIVNITIDGLLKLPNDPNKVLNGKGEWVEYTAKNSVVILTGSVNDGGTIPLPAGFTQDQCKWSVSMRSTSGRYEVASIICYADGNRVVTSRIGYHHSSGESGAGDGFQWSYASANYIVIGVK